MLVSRSGACLVLGARGRFEGVVDLDSVMESLQAQRTTTRTGAAPVGTNGSDVRVDRDDSTGEIRVIRDDAPSEGERGSEAQAVGR